MNAAEHFVFQHPVVSIAIFAAFNVLIFADRVRFWMRVPTKEKSEYQKRLEKK